MSWRPVFVLCLAEALSMAGFSSYPAVLPALRSAWGMSNTGAGLVGGAFFGGYMLAVPLLVGMTDRVEPRRVYFTGCALLAIGSAGFAFLARGVVTASAMQIISGAGLAGTYMPGLRELSERVHGPRQNRAIAFYTSTFGIGTSLSLLLAGVVMHIAGWRAVFLASAAGPIVAALLFALALPARVHTRATEPRRLFDFSPVLRSRAAAGIITGYAAHCWELFALRSWMVAFFAFLAASHAGTWGMRWGGPALAAAINLLGPPSSILGNEAAAGRRGRAIARVMWASAACAVATGLGAWLPGAVAVALVALYFVAIMSDSAALTAGLIEVTPADIRGGAMALHSFAGFAAGLAAPVVFGLLLDMAGGETHPAAWAVAFASLALVSLYGSFAVASGFRR
ncbi:MAG TPA: MFS transporter [Vicinamibacterales bacterium]